MPAMRLIKAAMIVLASLTSAARAEPSGAARVQPEPAPPARPAAPRALSAETLSDAEFAFVVRVGKHRLWRSRVSAPHGAKLGRIQSLAPGDAFAPIARSPLPAELAPLQGARVRLQTAGGEECEVTLKSWGVLAEYNSAPEGEDEKLSERQLARRAFTRAPSCATRSTSARRALAARRRCGHAWPRCPKSRATRWRS